MKLYIAPGACSISPHIAVIESGLPFEVVKVDFMRGKATSDGTDWSTLNPKGYVPALVLDNGQVLTEGAIIVQFIADLVPEAGLAPPQGSFERVRLAELFTSSPPRSTRVSAPCCRPWPATTSSAASATRWRADSTSLPSNSATRPGSSALASPWPTATRSTSCDSGRTTPSKNSLRNSRRIGIVCSSVRRFAPRSRPRASSHAEGRGANPRSHHRDAPIGRESDE